MCWCRCRGALGGGATVAGAGVGEVQVIPPGGVENRKTVVLRCADGASWLDRRIGSSRHPAC